MKAQAGRKWCDVHYKVGYLVYVKLRPYHQHIVAKRHNEKLLPRFFGHFPIVARVGTATYHLYLDTTIHLAFHVLLHRVALGLNQQATTLPLSLRVD